MTMHGKTVLITGATSGVGFHAAADIARTGARVFITGRDEERGRKAATDIRRLAGHDAIDFIPADASLVWDNVDLADEIGRRVQHLDVLINNAGGIFSTRRETEEGFESTLALNFIGPVVLTQQLLRLLGRSRSGRVINVISCAFDKWKSNPLDDPQSRRSYEPIEAYGHAKQLNLLFTLALAGDLAGTALTVNAVNPGPSWPRSRWFRRHASAASAASSISSLALSADAFATGRYLEGTKERKVSDRLLDPRLQSRAWDLGESLAARALSGFVREEIRGVM